MRQINNKPVTNFSLRFTPRTLLLGILSVKLLLGLLYITQQPLWQYHEADFLRVARYVRDNGQLPQLAAEAAPDTRNESQPPLYYYLLTPFVGLLDDNQPAPPGTHPPASCEGYNTNLTSIVTTRADNPPVQGVVLTGYVLRGLSLVMALVAVIFTYLTGRVAFPSQPAVALVGAAIIAFEPTLMRLAAEINNDNLILMVGAVHLWLCVRLLRHQGSQLGNSIGLISLGGLAVLSKLSGWLLLGISVALVAVVIGRLLWRNRSPRQTRIALVGSALLVIALVGLIVFNVRQYGSIFGRYRQLDALIGTTVQNLSWSLVSGMTVATIRDTIIDYQTPLAALQARAALIIAYCGLIVAGLLAALWASARAWRDKRFELSLLMFLWGYSLLVFGLVIFRSILNNTGWNFVNTMIIFAPVRYYAPALPALALLFIIGVMAITPARFGPRWNWMGFGAAACWLVVSAVWLSIPLRANQLRAASVITPEQFATLTDIELIDVPTATSGEPQVLGYRLQPHPAEGLIGVTLYLQTAQPLTTNYMAQVDLVSGDNRQSCAFLPARGLYPTPRWQSEEIIVVQADIPNCDAGLNPPSRLQLSWLPSTSQDRLAKIGEAGTSIELGAINEQMGMAAACPANLGIIGGGLQIVKNNTPASLELTGEGAYFVPSVNWLARSIPEQAVTRVYTVTQQDSDTTFTCAGTPRQQTYPFNRWTVGETIYFDECVMLLPPTIPTGTYIIQVGVQDKQGNWLPAAAPDGTPLADGQVMIGKVEIR